MAKSNKCYVLGCTATHRPWKGCSVGDFLQANPGWEWVLNSNGASFRLCPTHAREAAALAAQLARLTDEYCVNPILLRAAKTLGLYSQEEES